MSIFTVLRATFNRHQLLLARLGWTAVCLLILSMMTANLPHVYRDTVTEWQVGEAMRAALGLFPSRDGFLYTLITLRLITISIFVITAFFLAWRKWDDWFVLYISATLLMLGYFFGSHFDIDLIRYPQWLEQTFPAIRAVAPSLITINLVLFFYLFPNGCFTPHWLIWVTIPAILAILGFMGEAFNFSTAVGSFLDWLLPAVDDWWAAFMVILFGTILLGLAAQLVRYTQTPAGVARQQIKWVLFGLTAVPFIPLLGVLIFNVLQIDEATQHLLSLLTETIIPLAIPIAITFSVLRYRLWDVDALVNRAVVYGGLTAVILTLYGLSVGLLSNLIPAQDDGLTIFLALIVILFIINPLHRQVQRGVGRLLPIPPQPPLKEEAPPSAGPSPTPLLRLAHMIWVGTLFYFIWLAFERLRLSRIIINLGDDYLVSESLKLFTGDAADSFIQYTLWLRIVVTAVFWFTALFIFWHKRHDWVALAAAAIFLMTPFGFILSGSDDPVGSALSIAGLFITAAFPYIFPDGRFVPQSSRWRLALIVALFLTPILTYNIVRFFYPAYRADELGYVSLMATITVFTLAAISSQIYRYRHLSTPSQRQQTKWIVLGFTASSLPFIWVLVWLFGLLERIGLSEPLIALVMIHLTMIGAAALPVTFAFAILRYGLWQVDVWINRTFVFGGLTLLVTAVYILTVGLMSNLFQISSSVTLSVLATGLIAILFNPLRQRLQTAVNRLMYGQRDDPITVLNALGKRLEETAVPAKTLPALVETIAQTLKLPYVAIAVNREDLFETVAEIGMIGNLPQQQFPLIYQGEIIGRLRVAQRGPNEAFTAAEMRLLQNVAQQAGTAVYAYQLTDQLQRSRERLVTAREEERRRLRRDLHDGLGPQLATLAVKIGAVQNLLRTDPDTAEQLLAEVNAESQSAIKEIRQVVHGLRPSALDQLGLVSSLREFVVQNSNGRTQITFHAPDKLPALSAAAEVAAYRIATEAVTNTMRHAQAQVCAIHLEVNDNLCLKIRDDGDGLPDNYQPGVGLSSMRERAIEVGGSFEIQSTPEHGTVLTVRLPLTKNE